MEEVREKTVTIKYGLDEDGIPDVEVTVDGMPAKRLPSEGRGYTQTWEIVAEETWGMHLEARDW